MTLRPELMAISSQSRYVLLLQKNLGIDWTSPGAQWDPLPFPSRVHECSSITQGRGSTSPTKE
ncbi:unnamed protein product [Cylicocyclus nassatus]|uniref:Uncharacterized protein n=1 Tax=Cylicocyclus nassatus TaxID=53992 RepID=A0AA36LZJ6_CYLNA|nr:unnamed protein product [Cylicocyclus nassatus]